VLTYLELGQNGRLGNQMFQYAALCGTSFLRGYKFMISSGGHDLLNTFELGSQYEWDESKLPDQMYQEPSFLYDPHVAIVPDNTELKGYFQSPNYFMHCEDEIKKNFKFKQHILDEAEEQMKSLVPENVPTCAIHIRRGDYLQKSTYHACQPPAYYSTAAQAVGEQVPNVHFIIFSDDIEWCKNNMGGNLSFADNSPAVDMCIMSKCNIHIIANSSFSWWGAWLAESNAVIAPKQWFGPDGPENWETVYYPSWNIVG
tara:strand:- start:879 stop:1649 length:771 start_codon:yes stop_codon:yes gene_type:complete